MFDWPIVPVASLLSLQAALLRMPRGRPMPNQRVTLDGLLEGDTRHGACAGSADGREGCIRPGLLADLVLLPADPHQVAPHRMTDLVPRLTTCDGCITHQS